MSTPSPIVTAPDPDADARKRRRAAKRFNERLKTSTSFLNALGIALFVAIAITLPSQNDISASRPLALGLLAAIGLHILAQLILTLWRSEE